MGVKLHGIFFSSSSFFPLIFLISISSLHGNGGKLATLRSNGIRTRDLRVAGALLYQLSYEATHWERGQFIEFISPVRSEMMWSIWNNSFFELSSTTTVQKWIISYTSHQKNMNIAVLSQGLLSRIVGLSLVKKIRSRYATAFQLHWLHIKRCKAWLLSS